MRAEEEILRAITRATRRERLLIAAQQGRSVESGDQLVALLDAAAALRAAEIPFALIGGIAVGIRAGIPRATDDIDLAVATGTTRDRVISALTDSGFETRGEFEHSINFRHSNDEPVQVSFDPIFDDMIQRAEIVGLGEEEVPVVLKEDLIVSKERAAHDPARRGSKALRDQADLALLKGDVPGPDEGW